MLRPEEAYTWSEGEGGEGESEEGEGVEEIVCDICREGDREEVLLLCSREGCDGAAHCDCLRPVLLRVPEGEWFCGMCSLIGEETPVRGRGEERTRGEGSPGRGEQVEITTPPREISFVEVDSPNTTPPTCPRREREEDREELSLLELAYTHSSFLSERDKTPRRTEYPRESQRSTRPMAQRAPHIVVDTPPRETRRPTFSTTIQPSSNTLVASSSSLQVPGFVRTPAPALSTSTRSLPAGEFSTTAGVRSAQEWYTQQRQEGIHDFASRKHQNDLAETHRQNMRNALHSYAHRTIPSLTTAISNNLTTASPPWREKGGNRVMYTNPHSSANVISNQRGNVSRLPQTARSLPLVREVTEELKPYVRDRVVSPSQAVSITNRVLRTWRGESVSSDVLRHSIRRAINDTVRQ